MNKFQRILKNKIVFDKLKIKRKKGSYNMVICVYGAASETIHPDYIKAVEELGKKMAQRGHSLVYGAGATGLMGAVARGVFAYGGEIIGVAPTFFNVDGILFEHCTKLIPTETMRERKQIMEDTADAFIMVPGGVGTFDEFFEILTLKQLKRHNKGMAVFNIRGYYDAMQDMIGHAVEEGFVTAKNLDLFHVSDDVDDLLNYLEQYTEDDFDIAEARNL